MDEPKRSRAAIQAQMARLMAPDKCQNCPFKSRTCGTRGDPKAPIVIVGESPGLNEITEGRPFVGPSGELLSRMLKKEGIDEDEIYFINAIQCLPPRSRDKNGKSKKDELGVMNDAGRACRSRLIEQITAHPRDIVIAMGALAAKTTTHMWNRAITRVRGQMEESQELGCSILQTLHPAYILRNPSALPQLKSDLSKAAKMLRGEKFPNPDYKYRLLKSRADIREVFDTHRDSSSRIVADIETTGLDIVADKFLCIGFMFEDEVDPFGHNMVYVVDGRQNGAILRYLFEYAKSQEDTYKDYLEWVWHNGKFDSSFLKSLGVAAEVHQDTLLLSYTLDENGGRHSLEQCISDHLGIPNYKNMLEEYVGKGVKKRSYGDVPKPVLYDYLARDVVHTALLFRKLHEDVFPTMYGIKSNSQRDRRLNLQSAYRDLLIPAANTLGNIELAGMPIDKRVLLESEAELEAEIKPLVATMRSLLRDKSFNPNSRDDILATLKRQWNLELPDTKKETLEKHKANPLVSSLLEYKKKTKQLSTYITSYKKFGDRVHCSYLLHGTVTGRLSSTKPNLQNIPKKEIVRKHFCAPEGRVFVSFDYSQAELRSLAVLSGDQALIDIFKIGVDMHAVVAAKAYGKRFTDLLPELTDEHGKKYENPLYAELRRNAKTINFGIVYGATERTLMNRLGISFAEAHLLIDGWFKLFPKAKAFMEECRKAPTIGRLSTVFGRERRFYVTTPSNLHSQANQAGNFPHQSMCSDFTLMSAIEIDREKQRRGGRLPGNAFQVNIVHDDNLFECDDDDRAIDALRKIVQPIMERVPVDKGITALTFTSDAKKGKDWWKTEKPTEVVDLSEFEEELE
jgi:DNA polymerase-1